jgi:hypothetical protein
MHVVLGVFVTLRTVSFAARLETDQAYAVALSIELEGPIDIRMPIVACRFLSVARSGTGRIRLRTRLAKSPELASFPLVVVLAKI